MELRGVTGVSKRLTRVTSALHSLPVAFRRAIKNLERHVVLTFDTKGAHSGRKWRSLRASTLEARRRGWGYYRRGGGGRSRSPLVWTGALLRDFIGRGPRHIERVTPYTFEWGADYPKGFGSGRNWYRRVPLRFKPRQRTAVVLAPIMDYIKASIKE